MTMTLIFLNVTEKLFHITSLQMGAFDILGFHTWSLMVYVPRIGGNNFRNFSKCRMASPVFMHSYEWSCEPWRSRVLARILVF